jgi:hypothetical protein
LVRKFSVRRNEANQQSTRDRRRTDADRAKRYLAAIAVYAKAGCIAVVRSERPPPLYFKNQAWTGDWIFALLTEQRVTRLICGFINLQARACLTARGVDVRFGPCRKPAIELVSVFEDLPKA